MPRWPLQQLFGGKRHKQAPKGQDSDSNVENEINAKPEKKPSLLGVRGFEKVCKRIDATVHQLLGSVSSATSEGANDTSGEATEKPSDAVAIPSAQRSTAEMLHGLLRALANIGSHQYGAAERQLIVRQVVQQMLVWQLAVDHIAEYVEELPVTSPFFQEGAPPPPRNSLDESRLIVHNIPSVKKVPTWHCACKVVAERSGVWLTSVTAWTAEFLRSGTIPSGRGSRVTRLITTTSSLPTPYVLELLYVIRRNRQSGQITTYHTLQSHCNSDKRVKCSLDECPVALISVRVLARALRRTGAVRWAPVKRVGRLKTLDPVKAEVRCWRLRVFFAEWCKARLGEEDGRTIIVQQDESFCNAQHCSDFSLVETDEHDQPVKEVHRHAGKGPRLCITGAVSQYGPIVCNDAQGEKVRDHRWQTTHGVPVLAGGEFVELNNEGAPRAGYLKPKRAKPFAAMTVAELDAAAAELSVVWEATVRFKKEKSEYLTLLCESLHMPTPCSPDVSAQQSVLTDFSRLRMDLSDQARTTFKMFPANSPKGDYHRNFDTETFFKWIVSLVDTYPEWSLQMHERFVRGELPAHVKHGFWDHERQQPSRSLCLSLDNAPYHKGFAVQLASMSKTAIAELLRTLQITAIQFRHFSEATGQVVLANVEVPAEGEQWQHGYPSLAQVRQGAERAIRLRDAQLIELPYKQLLLEKAELWGPVDQPGVQLLWNAPYTSPIIFIEMLWAIGKNAVGRAENQVPGRTLAHVSGILHEAMFQNDTTLCRKLMLHCEETMSEMVAADHERHGGPLSGSVPHLKGLPDAEELLLWKKRAHMRQDFDLSGAQSGLGWELESEGESAHADSDSDSDSDGSVDSDEEV